MRFTVPAVAWNQCEVQAVVLVRALILTMR